ncbi:UNVERIFIED_CONTAM: hypothetical protein GTU68_052459 [Idotea baltica]|nr:hypothetical protein [Idotea baltica]
MALASYGAHIAATDINDESGQETVDLIKQQGNEAVFFHMDAANQKEITITIQQISESMGAVELGVNNAGIGGIPSPIHEIEYEHWKKVIDVNLSGVFFCMQAELRVMLANGGGKIVNISSLAGLNGMAGGAHYSASKHGVIGLSKTAAQEYGKYNIHVNTVCPGFIDTPIIEQVPQEILDYSTKTRVTMKRLGQPYEVAETICFLLSNHSSYVNGASINIDGGFMA